jgi:hypothetical protein
MFSVRLALQFDSTLVRSRIIAKKIAFFMLIAQLSPGAYIQARQDILA